MSDGCMCGCCAGVERATPAATENRPGLPALSYRVGTHSSFLETMLARLSSSELSALERLKTRNPSDPSIALLDGWATLADVLTFYQERVANEGFLRTATERRSILELGRLVGYRLRPGVAASVYLAYTLDDGARVEIPQGAKAQSIPGPGELPQTFETSEPLDARAEWNNLRPRMTRPQRITRAEKDWTDADRIRHVWFQGTDTKLEKGDPLLFVFNDEANGQFLRFVAGLEPDFEAKRTKVLLQPTTKSGLDTGFVDALGRLVAARLAAGSVLRASASRAAVRGVKRLELIDAAITAGEDASTIRELAAEAASELRTAAALPGTPAAVKRELTGLADVLEEHENGLRLLAVEPALGASGTPGAVKGGSALDGLLPFVGALTQPGSVPLANRARLARGVGDVFAATADIAPRLLTALRPELRDVLYKAWGARPAVAPDTLTVYALRVKASLFGHNASQNAFKVVGEKTIMLQRGWRVIEASAEVTHLVKPIVHEEVGVIDLEGTYQAIAADSWLVMDIPSTQFSPRDVVKAEGLITKAGKVNASISRADYGLTGKITKIALGGPMKEWINLVDIDEEKDDFAEIRKTRVYAQPEELLLAEEPILEPICDDKIELGTLYDELQAGRWLIVAGERADVAGAAGIKDAELVMLQGVVQDARLSGDKVHTYLTLANGGLGHCYKRSTVVLYGNVAKATHGETRNQVLGGGDGSQAYQRFALQALPLTYVAAPTPEGAESTLTVRVNQVRWREEAALSELTPTDRVFLTSTDDADKTTVQFGDGVHGARLPTGRENVKAVYRTGIGKLGNAKAEQISLLGTKPLGVKSVINPVRGSGGADRDSRDQARANVAIALRALGRLVSVQDYADFARSFAGIGKASAARLSDGARQVVHVTIAGADDVPIDASSDLYRNLLLALHRMGDPYQPIQLALRELKLLVVAAGVRVKPDYQWDLLEPDIRKALLAAFGFERRDLGEPVASSEILAAIQQVRGVAYVDLDVFDSVPERADPAVQLAELAGLGTSLRLRSRVTAQLARRHRSAPGVIRPAQLALLSPAVPDTLLLTELKR
jgi:hypothetical protein